MKGSQIALLIASVIIGLLWIGVAQDWLLQNVLIDAFSGSDYSIEDLFRDSVNPAFQALWVSAMTSVLIWLGRTFKTRPGSGKEVRQQQQAWWIQAAVLVLAGWALQAGYVHSYPIPGAGWLVLLTFVVLDVALLFWLPTLVATPRTFRLVVPGAVKFVGGR